MGMRHRRRVLNEQRLGTGQRIRRRKWLAQYSFLTSAYFSNDVITPSSVWLGFTEKTTAHGVPQVDNARGLIKKTFWTIVVLTMLTGLIYNLSIITKEYFDKPLDVTMQVLHQSELIYPAVTICNMSPVRKSAVQGNSALKDLAARRRKRRSVSDMPTTDEAPTTTATMSTSNGSLVVDDVDKPVAGSCCCTCCAADYLYGEAGCGSCSASPGGEPQECEQAMATVPVSTIVKPSTQKTTTTQTTAGASTATQPSSTTDSTTYTIPSTTSTTPPTTTTTTTTPPTTDQPITSVPENVRDDFKQGEELTEALADISVEDKSSLGYSVTDLVLDCKFSGHECYYNVFSNVYSPVLGNCYMFNSGWNSSIPLLHSTKVGRRYGLHLILNIDQEEYVKEVGDTAGVRLVVHPQCRMPFPEDEGITVSPGHSTSIGLRQVQIRREPYPYSNCTDPVNIDITRSVYEELYHVNYSTPACQKTCYQRNVIASCGCGDPYFPMYGKAFDYVKVKACESNNITQESCKSDISRRYGTGELHCNCPDVCRDTIYSMEVSLGQWPSNIQKESIFKRLSTKMGDKIYNPDYHYEENLIKLEVFYEEFNFENIDERPAYTSWNYLSDIGGILGLWVGFSIVTVFEFLELGSDLLLWFIVFRLNKGKVGPDSTTNTKPHGEQPSPPPPVKSRLNQVKKFPRPCTPVKVLAAPYFLSDESGNTSGLDETKSESGSVKDDRTPPPPYTSQPTSRAKSPKYIDGPTGSVSRHMRSAAFRERLNSSKGSKRPKSRSLGALFSMGQADDESPSKVIAEASGSANKYKVDADDVVEDDGNIGDDDESDSLDFNDIETL